MSKKFRSWPALSFLIAFFSLTVSAQDTTATIIDSTYHFSTGQYFKSYWTNGTGLLASPLHWKGKDWAIAGGTVATATSLYLLDDEINKPFSRWQSSFGNSFGKTGDALGPPLLVGGSLLVLGTGMIAKNQAITNFAADNLQAQIFTGGITFFVKELFGRARPYAGRGSQYWAGPFNSSGNEFASFFSGHSSVAFATATSIYLHSGKKWWVAVISYGVASSIAASRMQHGSHWGSDAFFGAVTGTAVSSFIYHQNQKRRKSVVIKRLP